MKKRKRRLGHLTVDNILLDSSNLPSFDTGRMEGRIELPLKKRNVYFILILFFLIVVVFFGRLVQLQVIEGAYFAAQSEENRLSNQVIIAERGVIYDRTGERLAWNEEHAMYPHPYPFPARAYTDRNGLGQLIGYVSYPQKDADGFLFRTHYLGRTGVEATHNHTLAGSNGERLVEISAQGEVVSENVVVPPLAGAPLTLSIDAALSEAIYKQIATSTVTNHFRSGAGAIMDVHTGQIIAMASFPSFDPEIMADGDDAAAIAALTADERFPFLNKVTGALFVPGSVVKPFVAYAALAEEVVSEEDIIESTGALTVPNPYNPSQPTVFRDWRVNGEMTVREALAFSSNVYFYVVGGGFGERAGLGISRLFEYFRFFGFGSKTGVALGGEPSGTVPHPAWKEEVFNDAWRLGDTYLTAIGQFGFQVTPVQILRAYGMLATGGAAVVPHVIKDAQSEVTYHHLTPSHVATVVEGMRYAVVGEGGTARLLERSDVAVAAKTGTAEVGRNNAFVNSWVAGYFPYEAPRFAFVLFMEQGPRENTYSAARIMSQVFDWIAQHRPEYLKS